MELLFENSAFANFICNHIDDDQTLSYFSQLNKTCNCEANSVLHISKYSKQDVITCFIDRMIYDLDDEIQYTYDTVGVFAYNCDIIDQKFTELINYIQKFSHTLHDTGYSDNIYEKHDEWTNFKYAIYSDSMYDSE